jgi:hypothetical protein
VTSRATGSDADAARTKGLPRPTSVASPRHGRNRGENARRYLRITGARPPHRHRVAWTARGQAPRCRDRGAVGCTGQTARAVVRSDRQHDGVIGRRPHREQAVGAVEVPAAHLVKLGSGQPVARRFAAPVEQLQQGRAGACGTASAQGRDLALRRCGQVDENRCPG